MKVAPYPVCTVSKYLNNKLRTCLPQHHFFSFRVIDDWNGLPEDTVNTDSSDLFKTYLNRFYYDRQYYNNYHINEI